MKKQAYSVSLTGRHQGVVTRITASPVAGYTAGNAVMEAIWTAFGVRPRPTRSIQGTMREERPCIYFHWNDNDGPHVFVTEHETIEEMARPYVAGETETDTETDGRGC